MQVIYIDTSRTTKNRRQPFVTSIKQFTLVQTRSSRKPLWSVGTTIRLRSYSASSA
jgi:hypothetical protein